MSVDYYYFCSQLPALRLGAAPVFTLSAFDERAAGSLPPADFSYVAKCGFPLDRRTVMPAGSAGELYRSWEFALRGEIARLRVGENRAGGVPLPPETGFFAGIREQLGGVASADNPLEREFRLDQLRWRRLDELEFGREFTVDAAACYRWRLAILDREQSFVAETGRMNFDEAVAAIEHDYSERESRGVSGRTN